MLLFLNLGSKVYMIFYLSNIMSFLLYAFLSSNTFQQAFTDWASVLAGVNPAHVFLPSLCSHGWLHSESRAGRAVCLSPVRNSLVAKHGQPVACQPLNTGQQQHSEEILHHTAACLYCRTFHFFFSTYYLVVLYWPRSISSTSTMELGKIHLNLKTLLLTMMMFKWGE